MHARDCADYGNGNNAARTTLYGLAVQVTPRG